MWMMGASKGSGLMRSWYLERGSGTLTLTTKWPSGSRCACAARGTRSVSPPMRTTKSSARTAGTPPRTETSKSLSSCGNTDETLGGNYYIVLENI